VKIRKGEVFHIHATKAYRVGKGMAQLISNLENRWRWAVNFTSQPLYSWERIPIPSEQEPLWAAKPVRTVSEKTKSCALY
jgi:hypothetical protein